MNPLEPPELLPKFREQKLDVDDPWGPVRAYQSGVSIITGGREGIGAFFE
jgi:hypothetical protein